MYIYIYIYYIHITLIKFYIIQWKIKKNNLYIINKVYMTWLLIKKNYRKNWDILG